MKNCHGVCPAISGTSGFRTNAGQPIWITTTQAGVLVNFRGTQEKSKYSKHFQHLNTGEAELKSFRGGEQDSQVFVWQGYTGKVELISFKTFLTKPVRRVALGGDHSLILTYDDCLFTCGSNEHGQLGVPDLSREYSFDPCLVHSLSGKGIQDIACGVNHCGCTTSDGSLYCWGDNQKGQCAADPSHTSSIKSPSQVSLSLPEAICEHGVSSPETSEHSSQVACGATHSVALTTEGNVWVWGYGPQLGLGELQETWKPMVLKCLIGKNVLKILSGECHNVLLVEEKEIEKKVPAAEQSKAKGGCSGSEVVVHKLQPSTCAKCKSEIYTYTETLDTCVIEEDHFCKDDSVKADTPKPKSENSGPKSENSETAACKGEQGDTVNKKHSTGMLETNIDDILSEPVTNKTLEIKQAEPNAEQRVDATDIKPTDSDNDPLKASSEKVKEIVAKDAACDKTDISNVEHSVAGKEAIQTQPGTDIEAELRKPGSRRKTMEESMTLSLRSDTSISSDHSCKFSRSISFLDETGAREYLARQFQDEDYVTTPAGTSGTTSNELEITATPDTPASPTAYMMQTMSSFTSHVSSGVTSVTGHMTSGMTSVTGHMTKALSGIASVPGILRLSTAGAGEDDAKSSTETLEVSEISDLETGSSENINLDNSILDISDLTMGDLSLNASQLSLPESERSLSGVSTPEGSPVKRAGKSSPRRSVSKEPQSIRTIEAKQENLRKRSVTLNPTEEDEAFAPTSQYTMATEVWTWGKNSRGQLGLGDMIERSEPYCIQYLSDKRIVKLACGSQHTLALNSSGEVYSWGLNASGQLGHDDMTSCPAKIQLTYDCCVWDVDAGNTHSIFLMDNAGTQGSRPDAFYAGKHPCKDLYVPVYKTPRLTPLKFVRKAGWIRSVSSGGDNCACLARPDTELTQIQFEMTRYVRQVYMRQLKIINMYIKRLQISGFYTSLDVYPYKSMMSQVIEAFIHVTDKIGVASLEVSDLLREGDGYLGASLLARYDDYVTEWRRYSTAYEDMLAVGGFEYCTKTGSSTFETLSEFYLELLPQSKTEEKVNHAAKFREIMFTPLKTLKELSQIIDKFSDLYEKTSKENKLLSSVHLNLEHLIRTSNMAVTDAENTKAFWESASSKVSDSLKTASRRLMKESKSSPLSLVHAGRFSTHLFYLFNDLLIHSQYSSYQSYPLETVWIDTPSSESSSHHYITVTTPEDVLNLNATSATVKVEWVVAFKTAINKVLANQKSVSRQNSGDRLHTPVIRFASHTFTKHLLYKDAKYKGYWLNGKIHGTGVMKWSDGRRYKGKFRHGAQTGYGVMMIPRDNNKEEVQEGNWKDGKLYGPGKIRYSTGDLYEGWFKDGLRHGHGIYRKGKYLNSASFVYVGEWLYDKKHGYGVMDDILKGEKHMGMWQEDSRHGDGVVVTLDGMYFEGNFQYNKLVGFGLMLTDDNSCYEGEFSGITMLQGKGTLIFPVGDKIEGTFSGTWNQGLKISSGIFHKLPGPTQHISPSKSSPEAKSSLYGKLCVRPDRKWEEIFYQCFENLHYSGEGEPNTHKAWDQVVNCIVAGKQSLKDKKRESLVSRQKLQLKNLDQLEKIPTHSVSRLSIEHFKSVSEYLSKAFETHAHPLGKLVEDLVDVFRAAYIGIGAHPRLLHHATREIQSFIKRIYRVIRILFPELPQSGGPTLVYPESSGRECSPIGESNGFLERQISQTDEDLTVETVSAAGILQPILLPRIYPALFDLYALHSDRTDEKYWERVQKLNKQGDLSLMAYLGIEQSFWCMDDSVFQDHRKRISGLRDRSYASSVEMLQQISTAFCPEDKLNVLQRTFLNITQTVQEYLDEAHMLCMDDLFPIFQYVVIRARLHHLGAEIEFIEELMEKHLEFGELGIMFTTLKACYYQIQNEKMPIH